MTYLTEHLPFASSSNHALPPSGSHLLISDTITAPAYFAIYHLISAAVLDKRKVSDPYPRLAGTDIKVVWVDFKGEGRSNLEGALKKLVCIAALLDARRLMVRARIYLQPLRSCSRLSLLHPYRLLQVAFHPYIQTSPRLR